ncbi:hypothetical protein [Frigoriglobus tundricola]|uniref:Uncharacterized protein n=1 Tax=Frigoriglobus tundricola TaxID=2774151 RepID=A0A6M5Z3E9_9BACT|nr:hypothetical protein [Frigoriglobus tundricola]QJX00277.1 hypothetical protein FTUN_7902 [Frigoriglobus tundricola]
MPLACFPILILLAPTLDTAVQVTIRSDAGDKYYSVGITKAALDKAPIWKDDADTPPLSARKAMKLAAAMKDKLVRNPDGGHWELVSMSLVEARAGQWFWQANYEWLKDGVFTGAGRPHLRLVVLMDGTVIEPEAIEYKRR